MLYRALELAIPFAYLDVERVGGQVTCRSPGRSAAPSCGVEIGHIATTGAAGWRFQTHPMRSSHLSHLDRRVALKKPVRRVAEEAQCHASSLPGLRLETINSRE